MVTARTRKATAPIKKATARKVVARKPSRTSTTPTKADLEKLVERLRAEVRDTVEEYTDDGTLCDEERKNIIARFKDLGVDFPVNKKNYQITFSVRVRASDIPYIPGFCDEMDEESDEYVGIVDGLSNAILPSGCYVDEVNMEDYFAR